MFYSSGPSSGSSSSSSERLERRSLHGRLERRSHADWRNAQGCKSCMNKLKRSKSEQDETVEKEEIKINRKRNVEHMMPHTHWRHTHTHSKYP